MDSRIPADPNFDDLVAVAEAFAELGARVAQEDDADPFQAITTVVRHQIHAATGVSITALRHDRFVTVAATDDRTRRADAIQYELGSGPCLDAIVAETMYRPRDLRNDERWPVYGRRVADEIGFLSMLSYRMVLPADDTVAGLNLYAEQVDAFTDRDAMIGLLMATHGAHTAALKMYERQVQNLTVALSTNRHIGTAIGVLMATHKVTSEQAFDLLRIASQNTNRKLAEIALDVIETGMIDVRPLRAPAPAPPATPSVPPTLKRP